MIAVAESGQSFSWLPLLQSFGIVAGILFTAFTIYRNTITQRASLLLSINAQHRALYQRVIDDPATGRILDAEIDLEDSPVTEAERFYIMQLIIHAHVVFEAQRVGAIPKLKGFQRDIASFLTLPKPAVVWREVKSLQNEDFAKFIERGLADSLVTTAPAPWARASRT